MGISTKSQNISGTINEFSNNSKTVVVGVNVYWLGTQIGTNSDFQGKFVLQTAGRKNDSLIIQYVGYKTDTLLITNFLKPLEIVLNGSKTLEGVEIIERELGSYISKASIIQSEKITGSELCKAACCNLSESFQTNASVDVNYSDAMTGSKQIQLLGLAGIYSQLMTENIPNFRGLSVPFSLGYIPGTWMESIQISKGLSSVINGYESITGQINVEYKNPKNEEKLFFNGYGSSFGKLESNINSSFHVGKKLNSIILGHFENLSYKTDENADGFMDDPLIRQFNIMSRWSYDLSNNVSAKFGISILDEDRKMGQNSYNFDKNAIDTLHFGSNFKTKRYEAYAKTGHMFDSLGITNLGLVANITYHNLDAFFGKNRYSGTQKSAYFNSIFHSQISNKKQQYDLGFSFTYDEYSETLNDSVMKREEIVPGAFLQYTFNPTDNFVLITGFRADYHSLAGLIYTPRIHAKWMVHEKTILRMSAGKGFRSASMLAENMNILLSSRTLHFDQKNNFEEAYNFGVNLLQDIDLFEKEITLSADFYRTNFVNQLIIDFDKDERSVYIYNLNGKSYSNSFQIELKSEVYKNLEVTAAFRLNDVHMTINDTLREKPYLSKFKSILSLSYQTNNRKWKFDFTSQFNGGGRIPSTKNNTLNYQREESFSPYTILYTQITRTFKKFELYGGVENITNFKQENPIIAASEPFSKYFDSSMIWGPVSGRVIYLGFRLKLVH